MPALEWLDLTQTFAIVALVGALVWNMRLLRLELRSSAQLLKTSGDVSAQERHVILESLEVLRQRVRDLEIEREERKARKRERAPTAP
jgi:hypothetical protein